jgi:tetratricopeptide (TPR) repeat protein
VPADDFAAIAAAYPGGGAAPPAPIPAGIDQRRTHTMRLPKTLAIALLVASFATSAWAQKGGKGKKVEDTLEYDPEGGAPPSRMLERAIKLYEKKDYPSASIELKKVLSGETDDDDKNKQRAEFYLGKTVYHMGYYAAALKIFEDIVQGTDDRYKNAVSGPAHSYHGATLKWLAALSRVLPETSGILDLIGTYDVSFLDDPIMSEVRDELYYLLGRHFYRKGKFEDAINLFTRVSRDSEFFIKAKFFEGVTYVRKLDGKPAGEAFKEILVIGRERPKQYRPEDIDQYEELAIMQMARVFYSTGNHKKAIEYYEKLEQDSPDWATSLFEASWAYFMLTNNSKALGNIHTLNAPYFENEFYPESVLLKAVIYYKYCQYDRSLESVAEYNEKYQPLRKNLQDVIGKFEDNAEFYEYVRKIRANRAGLDAVTQRLTMSVLQDKTLMKTFSWVDELDKEIKMFESSDAAWRSTAVAVDVQTELELRKSEAETQAGKLARERINRLITELQTFGRDGIKIRIEVLNAKANKISDEARKTSVSADHKEEPIVIDDEHFMWKFNGEYWKDELGYYRFRIRSKCPKK